MKIILNTKVTVIEIKNYQFRNILIKLDHIQKVSEVIAKNQTFGEFN